MKKLKFLFLIVFSALTACSSDDAENTGNAIEQPDPFIPELVMYVNGEETYRGTASKAWRIDDTFEITLRNGNWLIQFDKEGRFGRAAFDLYSPNGKRDFFSFRAFSSHYFDFNLTAIDETQKRISGSFSGYVYGNETNLMSEIKYVNGTFDLKYRELLPSVSNLKQTAKMNGQTWVMTRQYITNNGPSKYICHALSDDAYEIAIYYDLNSSTGTYTFANDSTNQKVKLLKYNPETNTYTTYNCSGTLVLSQNEARIFSGQYSFTATNPNDPSDVIEVNNGNFKFLHS